MHAGDAPANAVARIERQRQRRTAADVCRLSAARQGIPHSLQPQVLLLPLPFFRCSSKLPQCFAQYGLQWDQASSVPTRGATETASALNTSHILEDGNGLSLGEMEAGLAQQAPSSGEAENR